MNIALLGKGKTGSKVAELALDQGEEITIFDTSNPVSLEALKDKQVIISFLPGEPFLNLIPLLVESGLPVVTGSTGFDWPSNLDQTLKEKNLTWIWGHNFSLGINLVKSCLEILGKASDFFPEVKYHIHEVHHTKKLDAPSGTAISFENWLGQKSKITSERTGDVVGIHELSLKTEFETITLKHQAHDRKIFANGALFAAKYLIDNNLPTGLLNFSDFMKTNVLKI